MHRPHGKLRGLFPTDARRLSAHLHAGAALGDSQALVCCENSRFEFSKLNCWGPQAAALSRQPSLFRQHYRVGFGLSLDQNNAGGTVTSVWDTKNFS